MTGLRFTLADPVPAHPLRADIALFVGYVRPRAAASAATESSVPVAIDSWDDFTEHFVWDDRPLAVDRPERADTYLGAAVRAFFAAGGRKCWIVSVGEPWAIWSERRLERLEDLLPAERAFSRHDTATWRGAAQVLALPEVSLLCLPDLPDVVATRPVLARPEPVPASPEPFVEDARFPQTIRHERMRHYAAPVTDADGFAAWAGFVARLGRFLWAGAREVQFIAALPRPISDAASGRAQWDTLASVRASSSDREPPRGALGSAFVQVVHPWVEWRDGARVPGQLEPGDGLLAGLLANHALTRGAFQSAAGTRLPRLVRVDPEPGAADLAAVIPPSDEENSSSRQRVTAAERISFIGPSSGGLRLLSDVTTDLDPAYRPANVNRLVSAVVRAARLAGEHAMFESNGEALWRRLVDSLRGLLTDLWREGALEGATVEEAFEVRCDRTTMTTQDLDDGRVIVWVRFTAAAPITEIEVVLSLDESGQVSVRRGNTGATREAA